MSEGTTVLTLRKGNHFYLFAFGDSRCDEMCDVLGRFAADPDLGFTWFDASVLGERVREREQIWTNRLSLEERRSQ